MLTSTLNKTTLLTSTALPREEMSTGKKTIRVLLLTLSFVINSQGTSTETALSLSNMTAMLLAHVKRYMLNPKSTTNIDSLKNSCSCIH